MALTVHANTVAYRLSRAEEVLGRDLRSMASRMELQLALTIRDVQRAGGSG
ncbi:MAG: helix-turn-helix domain-containing protein [Actinomycetota bacterium]|nr:helix-turn-helix domain-containing protein [Actinomycetota bacterium]